MKQSMTALPPTRGRSKLYIDWSFTDRLQDCYKEIFINNREVKLQL
jgi:hypothetical protein